MKRLDSVTTGLSLPPVVNFLMEDSEEVTFNPYVDDNFAMRHHGPDNLRDFLHHLRSVHQNIKFTVEMKRDSHPLFLNIYIYRRPDGCLSHKAHSKPTHTSLYCNSGSYHHPSNKYAGLSILMHRVRALCNQHRLHGELEFLRVTLKQILQGLQPFSEGSSTQKQAGLSCFPTLY
jgi:hypothetical protein